MVRPLISVIIPVYNVEEYLEKCVKSVCKQSYSNLQIILVDDGSTDGSGALCEDLAKQDDRITVIHKANGGLASARNKGNKAVEGDYLTYIDSDDFVGMRYIENLYSAIERFKADLVITGATKTSNIEYNNENDSNTDIVPKYIQLSSTEAIRESLDHHRFGEHAWGRLYCSRLLPYLEFPLGRNFEDAPVSCRVLYESKVIVYEDSCDYYYFDKRAGSITNTYSRKYMDCLESFWDVYTFTKKYVPSLRITAENRYYGRIITCLGVAYLSLDENFNDEVFEKVKDARRYVICESKCPKSTKCAYLLSFFGKRLISWLAAKLM